jgi:hypothetical protein
MRTLAEVVGAAAAVCVAVAAAMACVAVAEVVIMAVVAEVVTMAVVIAVDVITGEAANIMEAVSTTVASTAVIIGTATVMGIGAAVLGSLPALSAMAPAAIARDCTTTTTIVGSMNANTNGAWTLLS